jgi:hypothetical protein
MILQIVAVPAYGATVIARRGGVPNNFGRYVAACVYQKPKSTISVMKSTENRPCYFRDHDKTPVNARLPYSITTTRGKWLRLRGST